MQIKGFVKTSLVDYPGHLATTLFTSGCNMHCPYCHNSTLINNDDTPSIDPLVFFDYLNKRAGILEAVCVSGGEPTLQEDLIPFLLKLRSFPLKIKLDTNGLNPHILEIILAENLIDYLAMDIKNSPLNYPKTTGISPALLPQIEKSVNLIKNANIPYEFRTTVAKEFHTTSDFLEIGAWLKGAKKYVLQPYQWNEQQLSKERFTPYSKEAFLELQKILLPYFEQVEIRGF